MKEWLRARKLTRVEWHFAESVDLPERFLTVTDPHECRRISVTLQKVYQLEYGESRAKSWYCSEVKLVGSDGNRLTLSLGNWNDTDVVSREYQRLIEKYYKKSRIKRPD